MKITLKPTKLDAVRTLVGHGISGDDDATDVNYRGKTPAIQSQIDAKYDELIESWNNSQYQRDRLKEYPTIEELVVALYDEEDKQAIIEKRNAVKAKYPKPE